MRKVSAGLVACLIVLGGCGGATAARTAPVVSGTTAATAPPGSPTDFRSGYAQAWGEIKRVGAGIGGVINQVRQAKARHRSVSDVQIASEFAGFASRIEPAVIELQGLTPPRSIARPYKALATAALEMSGALRNFSTDANANRVAQGRRDLANLLAYAATIDTAATEIYGKIGIK
jgi:ABC-type glycerol-3-phosphate transport system substrate-binding protein